MKTYEIGKGCDNTEKEIADADECFKAARQLGYKDQNPRNGSWPHTAPGCSVNKVNIIFNTNGTAEQKDMPDDDGQDWMGFLDIICEKKYAGLSYNTLK